MLRITREQLDPLAAPMRSSFRDRLRPRLRKGFPDRAGPRSDGDLDTAIDEGVASAASHGVHAERDVERYVYLTFALGPDFDRALPWAADILAKTAWSSQVRLDLLCAIHEGRLFDGPENSPFCP